MFFFFSHQVFKTQCVWYPQYITSHLGTFQGLSGHVWLMAALKDSAALTSLDQRGASCLTAQGSKEVTIF